MDVDRHCDVSSSRTKRVTLRGTYFSVDEKKKKKNFTIEFMCRSFELGLRSIIPIISTL